MALPDFQRDFVWSPDRVIDLLDSVAKRWPIGSILILNGPQPFAIKSIYEGPELIGNELEYYILDGQQRITSLYHAIYDKSSYCYYVDFDVLLEEGSEFLLWERRSFFEKKYPDIESRSKNKKALIKDIWNIESFYEWLESMGNPSLISRLIKIKEMYLGGLKSEVYRVNSVELEQEVQLEALARIFETINTSGVKLSAFDLMVAALYPFNFNLKNKFKSAIEENPSLRIIEDEPNEILKMVSLLMRMDNLSNSRGVKHGDILQLDKNIFISKWDEAVKWYVASLEYCKKNFGVISSSLIPAPAMILMVGLMLKLKKSSQYIRHWWLNKVLTQYYSQAANTRIMTDFSSLMKNDARQEGNAISLIFKDDLYNDSARKNGILLRGVAGEIIASGAQDPESGKILQEVEDISFFEMLNGTFKKIDSDSIIRNIVIVDKANLKKYKSNQASMFKYIESQGFDEYLNRHHFFKDQNN
jgi:Uncharacterized conserved protein